MNVDQNRMLSLTVKVSFSYSHFQNLRENTYYQLSILFTPKGNENEIER